MVKINRLDAVFAQVFHVQLAVVFLGALKVVAQALSSIETIEIEKNIPKRTSSKGQALVFLLFIAEVTAASLFSCALVFVMMTRYTKIIIPLSYFSVPAFFAFLSLYYGTIHGFRQSIGTIVVSVIVLFLTTLSYGWVRKHVDFAASTLEVSIRSVSIPVVVLAFSASVLIVMWLIVWSVGCYGILRIFVNETQSVEEWFTFRILLAPQTPDGSAIVPTTIFLAFLSLYWTVQVINNLVHTTTARTVVAWWWNDKLSAIGALQTSCTTLLGPICKGSLFVAAIQALHSTVSFLCGNDDRRRNRNNSAGIGQAIVRLVGRLAEYINYWTFVVLAVHVDYGSHRILSYTESGEKLKVISKRRGLSSFLADRLAYSALWFSHLFVAFLTSAIVYAAERVRYDGKDGWPMVAGILGFLASYMIASASLVCVESAVRTVIICFAEFPERFRAGHPEEYNKLERGWSKAYPTAWSVSNHLSKYTARN
jgi:hypothetical protein